MNIHDRRRKLTIGISFIEEVIADVLREHSGDAPFSTKRVCDLVGFNEAGEYWLCYAALAHMKHKGEVSDKQTTKQAHKWVLAD